MLIQDMKWQFPALFYNVRQKGYVVARYPSEIQGNYFVNHIHYIHLSAASIM